MIDAQIVESLRRCALELSHQNVFGKTMDIRQADSATGVGEEFCLMLETRITDHDLGMLFQHPNIFVRQEAKRNIGGTMRLLDLTVNLRKGADVTIGSIWLHLGGPDGISSTHLKNALIKKPEDVKELFEGFLIGDFA